MKMCVILSARGGGKNKIQRAVNEIANALKEKDIDVNVFIAEDSLGDQAVELEACPFLAYLRKREFSDVTVIIPTLNEEEGILQLINILEKSYPKIKIIVSDDGSKDGTRKVVKKCNLKNANIMLLDRDNEKIHGLTASVVDAIQVTRTKYLVVMDGDLQHPPEKVNDIVEKLRQGADLVVATREGIVHKSTFSRILIQKLAASLARLRLSIAGMVIKDPMSGFFGAKTELIQRIIKEKECKFELGGYKILFDILKFLPSGVLLTGVYFKFGMRKKGKSKLNKKVQWLYLKSLFR